MARQKSTFGNVSFSDAELMAAALFGLQVQKERIEGQIRHVQGLLGQRRGRPPGREGAAAPRKKRRLSAAARRKMSLAAKRRWAALKKGTAEKAGKKADA